MGTMAVNRLGQKFAPVPEPIDRTPNLVANVMLRRPQIQGCELLPDGCCKFNLPWKGTGMTMADLRGSRLARSRWFGNTLGEYLTRIHLHQFDSIVLDASYPRLDRSRRHGQFGYRISNEGLEFKFNAELLHRLFNEEIRREIREVAAVK